MNVFDTIYKGNGWGGTETRSGPGAGSVERRYLAPDVAALVEGMGFESVLDVGCGEGFWTPDLPGYIGIDVSEVALETARKWHPDRDLRLDDGSPYPTCDLVLVRCVIQHLSFEDGLFLLERVFDSGATWLLCTSYKAGHNVDIKTGAGYWPDMTKPPFSLGDPVGYLLDGRTDNDQSRFPALGLWWIG